MENEMDVMSDVPVPMLGKPVLALRYNGKWFTAKCSALASWVADGDGVDDEHGIEVYEGMVRIEVELRAGTVMGLLESFKGPMEVRWGDKGSKELAGGTLETVKVVAKVPEVFGRFTLFIVDQDTSAYRNRVEGVRQVLAKRLGATGVDVAPEPCAVCGVPTHSRSQGTAQHLACAAWGGES